MRLKIHRPSGSVTNPKDTLKHALYGLLITLSLIASAFLAGCMFPHLPKYRPIPMEKRTICKRVPLDYNRDLARGKSVLITGASGFTGSYVARFCSEELGMDVVGLGNLDSQGASNIQYSGDIRVATGDLTNVTMLANLFQRHKFDVVYHLDDRSSSAASFVNPTMTYSYNLVGSVNLISEAVKNDVEKFVMLSSDAVYGNATGPWAESSAPTPVAPYGISKLAAEQHLASSGDHFGMDYSILRVHGLYGPRMDMQSIHSTIVARSIAMAIAGKEIGIEGDGTQKRQYTYIEDIVPIIAAAPFTLPSGTLMNLGSDELTTVQEVVNEVAEAFEISPKVTFGEELRGSLGHTQVVHDLSHCMFNILPTTLFKDGIKKTIEWANATRAGTTWTMQPGEMEISVDAAFLARGVKLEQANPNTGNTVHTDSSVPTTR